MSPIWEYICPKCKKFEHLHKSMKEEALKECPTCGSKVEKIISGGIGINLVGYGWPSKDIRNPPPPPSSTNIKKQRKKQAKLRKEGFQEPFIPKP